jgi:hypothetical protein
MKWNVYSTQATHILQHGFEYTTRIGITEHLLMRSKNNTRHGADLNTTYEEERTPLNSAYGGEQNHLEIMRILLEHGADASMAHGFESTIQCCKAP